MKKVSLVALLDDREALLRELQRAGEVMLVGDSESAAKSEDAGAALRQSEQALRFLTKYREKSSFFEDRPTVDIGELLSEDDGTAALQAEVLAVSDQMADLATEKAALLSKRQQFAPWLSLDIPLDELSGTKTTAVHTGFCPPGTDRAVKAAADESGAELILLDLGPEGRAAVCVCHRSDEYSIMDAVKTAGFSESSPPRASGTAADANKKASERLSAIEAEHVRLTEKATELAKRQEELLVFCEKRMAEDGRAAAATGETDYTFYLTGYARSDRVEKVKKTVAKVTDVYDLEFSDPGEDEKTPTYVKNNWFIDKFETITDMFSRPDPHGLDPNPVMGFWYWIIFGMMMGDAGYGVAMAVLITLFIKLKKPRGDFGKLVHILLYSSVTTIFWGVVFGSYFGETWNPLLFAPLDNPVMMLVICLVIGVLHIFSGMILKMIDDIRHGHVLDAIFDQLSWMVLIVGLGLLFLPAPLSSVGMVLAVAGAATVFLTAGRAKKGIFSKITGGLLGLYNITSFASDILSYSRILALSLATGVVGMVMNLLASMVQGSIIGFAASLLIYLVGHVFNLAMGLLSAYVHSSRLQYIEFFSKFYEGGGYKFEPLSVEGNYVNVADASANKK